MCDEPPFVAAKLADFGLARALQEDSEYYKRVSEESALPVRWMDPESLAIRRLTTKSDVWSFGVVLWELWSRGATPYAEIQAATEVVLRVQQGYRLQRPAGCPEGCYALMRVCWEKSAEARPSFAVLEQRLGDLGHALATAGQVRQLQVIENPTTCTVPAPSAGRAPMETAVQSLARSAKAPFAASASASVSMHLDEEEEEEEETHV